MLQDLLLSSGYSCWGFRYYSPLCCIMSARALHYRSLGVSFATYKLASGAWGHCWCLCLRSLQTFRAHLLDNCDDFFSFQTARSQGYRVFEMAFDMYRFFSAPLGHRNCSVAYLSSLWTTASDKPLSSWFRIGTWTSKCMDNVKTLCQIIIDTRLCWF